MINILIAYASQCSVTKDMAERMALILRREGMNVVVDETEMLTSLNSYQTVIIGSELYCDQWLPAASELLESFQDDLAKKQLWLFSRGMAKENCRTYIDGYCPEALKELVQVVKPQGMVLFRGNDDWFMNASVDTVDYRDWEAVDAWAMTIANTLKMVNISNTHKQRYFTQEDMLL